MEQGGEGVGVRVEQFADLLSIGNGAAVEKFYAELEKVKANIKDPNTEAEDKRTITLRFSFHPTSDRETVAVNISAQSGLPASKPTSDTMYLGKKDGELVATVMHPHADPRQGVLPLHSEKKANNA